MRIFDDSEIARATAAYGKWCRRKGCIYQQPNSGLSEQIGDTITLRNINGVLAKFNVNNNGKLRRIFDEDTE